MAPLRPSALPRITRLTTQRTIHSTRPIRARAHTSQTFPPAPKTSTDISTARLGTTALLLSASLSAMVLAGPNYWLVKDPTPHMEKVVAPSHKMAQKGAEKWEGSRAEGVLRRSVERWEPMVQRGMEMLDASTVLGGAVCGVRMLGGWMGLEEAGRLDVNRSEERDGEGVGTGERGWEGVFWARQPVKA
ncbi:MAG: hypothetical protein MMC23_001562 [Stictis urceolatum]|nr:hypothetical protein [Stictis urceolata]